MPRRPNTKNLPSRLFEDSATPLYVVNGELKLVYANPALCDLLALEQDEVGGTSLQYLADDAESLNDPLNLLCPPPRLFASVNQTEDQSVETKNMQFPVALPDGREFLANSSHFTIEGTSTEHFVVCSLAAAGSGMEPKGDSDWLHHTIQKFRVEQGQRFNSIPYLGDSPIARKCFAQARSFALLGSNVSLVGHPRSQTVDVAKSIHYSGFSQLEQPDPLLPVDCRQVKGDRIQEILKGHYQVSQADDVKSIDVLLMNADVMDGAAQRDLLHLITTEKMQVRFITTSRQPLAESHEFDAELACLLSTLELQIPDLVHRPTDIPLVAQNILEKLDGKSKTISAELIEVLQIYPWQHDFQEVESVIKTAHQNSDHNTLTVADCPHDFRMALKALDNPHPIQEPIELDQFLADIEKEVILRAIRNMKGNKTNAARILGITRARLHRKIAEFGENSTEAE